MSASNKELAVCQMNVLETVLSGGGMDISQAIVALQLDDKKYERIARSEGFEWIADQIKFIIGGNQ